MSKKSVAVVFGYWSTNIGNSFFQIGAEYIIKRAFPQADVLLAADQPGYYRAKHGNPENAFIPLEHMSTDYLIILGPFLRPEYKAIWSSTLEKLSARGTRTILLSAGMMDYGEEFVERARQWIGELNPYVLTTRDEFTYRCLADLGDYTFNGIDAAFFVSDLYDPATLDIEDYVVFNFDKIPEPHISAMRDQTKPGKDSRAFQYEGTFWCINEPKLLTSLSRHSRLCSLIAPLLRSEGSFPSRMGDKRIVRTDHRFNPLFVKRTYRAPNSFVSDVPWPYLDIYSQASCVFSSRVHACVAALAYGRPAMLFYRTPRARLLQRVGADEITQRPCTISDERLKKEKKALLDFLQQVPL